VHENEDLAVRLFAAIEQGDVDAVAALYADDAVIWHNFDNIEQSRELNLVVLAWMAHNVSGLRYDDIRRQHFDGGFVQQHVLRGTTKAGADLEVPSCLVVHVDGGHITRVDEYLDTAHLRVLADPATPVSS
jgi:ketosteroid isomerase-like protein